MQRLGDGVHITNAGSFIFETSIVVSDMSNSIITGYTSALPID